MTSTAADAAIYLHENRDLTPAEQVAMDALKNKLWILHHARDYARGVVILLSSAKLLVDRQHEAHLDGINRSEQQRLKDVAAEWEAKYRAELAKQIPPPPNPTIPPDGYTLPKAAQELLDYAEENGWLSKTTWGASNDGTVQVSIQLAHHAANGDSWQFDHLGWAATGSGASMARRGRGLQRTPQQRAWHDAMSLVRIRAVIAANAAGAAE